MDTTREHLPHAPWKGAGREGGRELGTTAPAALPPEPFLSAGQQTWGKNQSITTTHCVSICH